MFIEFDPIKEASNSAKHGVSLAEAEELDWDSMVIKRDDRHVSGEQRFIGYALKEDRLYCIVFTERGAQRRVISLRKANEREVRRYVTEN